MSKDIEIEERAMISEATFQKLVEDFGDKATHIFQTNYYFDTEKLDLILKHDMMLRVRQHDNTYHLTLKIKGENGDIEITDLLAPLIYIRFLDRGQFPKGEVMKYLLANNIDINKLKFITLMHTERYQLKIDNYEIFFDKNKYSDVIDYNFEIEVQSNKKEAINLINFYASKYNFKVNNNYLVKSKRALNVALGFEL